MLSAGTIERDTRHRRIFMTDYRDGSNLKMINDRNATAEDIERLGETVRRRVRETSGVALQWEIIRLGLPKFGHPMGEALAEALAQG